MSAIVVGTLSLPSHKPGEADSHRSPASLAAEDLRAFALLYSTGCGCPPGDLRAEVRGLECAGCGKRLVRVGGGT